MKKLFVLYLTIGLISLLFSGIYLNSLAENSPETECPYLKNNLEKVYPYLEEKDKKIESACPYLNGELRSSKKELLSMPQCPYLQRHKIKEKHFNTLKNISS